MFSGVGGFECGIGEHGECIGYSEIDKYATAIYDYHFGGHKNYGNATAIISEELPDFELLVGGFPCQAFSIAGKRLGFDDTRGTLFFEIARILKVKRPKHFILENVKGLLSHDSGRTFKTIISTLVELGYGVEWQVLNSKNHGVPQNRERVFIVGHLGGEGCGKVFPIGENFTANNEEFGHERVFAFCDSGLHRKYQIRKNILPPLRAGRADRKEEPAYAVWKDSKIRRLTPVECERLQGFPDNWTKYGKFGEEIKEISDSQRYKCLGNAVTTNVIKVIIDKLYGLL